MYTPPAPLETKVAVLEERMAVHEQMMSRIDTAIEKLSEVNINTNEKVDDILFTKIDQLGSKMDSDHNVVLSKIQDLEKKVWISIGVVFCLSFIIQNSNFVVRMLTPPAQSSIIGAPHR